MDSTLIGEKGEDNDYWKMEMSAGKGVLLTYKPRHNARDHRDHGKDDVPAVLLREGRQPQEDEDYSLATESL